MISHELARQLKVAGLAWRPRQSDVAIDRLSVELFVVRDGTDEAGGVLVETGRGREVRSELGLCWLPRLSDLLAQLARHGDVELLYRAGQPSGRWSVAVRTGSGTVAHRAWSAEEATGLAVLGLLSAADEERGVSAARAAGRSA